MDRLENIKAELNSFIKKYYKNKFLKGLLASLVVFLLSLYLISIAEFYGRFSSNIRFIFLSFFILLNGYILIIYCLSPLFSFVQQTKRLSHEKASKMIGILFPDISDQLTNLLQLDKKIKEEDQYQIELLKASIEQKINKIGYVKFSKAISYSENKRYLKYVLPPVFMFFIFTAFIPEMFTQGSFRILNFSKQFQEKAPFIFLLKQNDLKLTEGEDLYIKVELIGNQFPNRLYINSDQGIFLMNKIKSNTFECVLRKPINKQTFFFSSSKFNSQTYEIEVLGKSMLGKWDALIKFPKYLEMEDLIINNSADITVPEGSIIFWSGKVKNISKVSISYNEMNKNFFKSGFSFTQKCLESSDLIIQMTNSHNGALDSLNYFIQVIKDSYPEIKIQEERDSLKDGLFHFKGTASDDYGLYDLNFNYDVSSKNKNTRSENIRFKNINGTKVSFEFSIDFTDKNIALSDEILYYFSVTDNDGVNGHKTSLSNRNTYQIPDLKTLNKNREKEQNNIKKELNDVLKATEVFQKEINELNKEFKKNKNNEWNKLNDLNNLKDQQQDLLNKLENIQERLDKSLQEKNKLSELDKELLKKQDLLEDLLKEVMDDELKKLLEELEELLKKNDQKQLNEKMEELDQSAEDMKKQLDRSLEMLKKLQVNEKIDDLEKELKDLAKKQKDLAVKKEKTKESQDEIKEAFKEIEKGIKELEELNKKLETPMDIESTDEEQKEIEEKLNEAGEKIEKNKKNKASESQGEAGEKMEDLAEQLNQMQQESEQSQNEEDMEDLRKILEALVLLSMDQEDLLDKFNLVQINDPAFRKYGRKQRRINDDTKIVKDSLLALAKRQPVLATFIDKELNDLAYSQGKTIEFVGDRKKKNVTLNQQLSMTAYNNLALLLNEVLQSMQAQMQAMKPGSGQCNKPGGKGKPKAGPSMKPGDMKEMLKNQLDQLKKGMQDGGKNPGGKKNGEKDGKGDGGIGSQGLAKMAAEQSAIRKKLEELRDQLNKEGKGEGNALNPLIEELKEQQKRIINKKIDKETFTRQQDILTRLLESEKALIERGFEDKRESKGGKNIEKSNQILFNQYNKEKLKKIELLRFAEPSYKKYYKEKANEYFNEN